MESITKQLVNIGHGMSREIAADEPAVAKLLVELSSALDVQYERGNALEAKLAALAEENAGLKAAHPQPFGPVMMKALDAYEKHQDETPEIGMLDAFFILRDSIRADTTATDAFLAEVRAQGVEMMAAEADQLMDEFGDDSYKVMVTADLQRFANAFAAQLRKGVQS